MTKAAVLRQKLAEFQLSFASRLALPDTTLHNDTLGDDVISGSDLAASFKRQISRTSSELIFAAPGPDWAGIEGTPDGDNLFGTPFDDSINGQGGDDTIHAGGGNDYIDGSAGNDTLFGEGGNDYMIGGPGYDTFDGGDGDQDSVNYTQAAAGVTVNLSVSTPQSTGGAGIDTVLNVEHLTGSDFGDTLTGDAANNHINGIGGDDTISGLAGNDYLDPGSGINTVLGGDGNDYMVSGPDNDTYDGGDGDNDSINYIQAAAAITLSLSIATPQNTGGAGIDTVRNVEDLTGSDFNDTLTGDAANNHINGIGGGDTISGLAGNDYLDAGSGNDTLFGGDDGDWMISGSGNDTLDGGAGDDHIDGGEGTDTASYGTAAAAVTVDLSKADGQDTSGAGWDTLISIENLIGSAFGDTLTGNELSNTILGGAGSDAIEGGNGADFLFGEGGNDYLTSVDGFGGDTLNGGADRDFFAVDAGDTIVEFATEDDAIVVQTDTPIANISMLARYGGGSEVRLWEPGLGSFSPVFISNRIDPATLDFEVYGSGSFNGVLITNAVAPGSAFEKLAIDYNATIQRFQSIVDANWRSADNALIGNSLAFIRDIALDDKNYARTVFAITKEMADYRIANAFATVLKNAFLVVDVATASFKLGTYISEAYFSSEIYAEYYGYRNSDGSVNISKHVATLTDIIVDFIPFGDTLLKYGSALLSQMALDLYKSVNLIIPLTAQEVQVSFTRAAEGNPTNNPTDGPDVLFKTNNQTTYEAGGGNDVLVGTQAATSNLRRLEFTEQGAAPPDDTFDGGPGDDTISYAQAIQAVLVDLELGQASGGDIGQDLLVDIENAFGGSASDVLLGNNQANVLRGNDGNDTVEGRGGIDSLFGDEGNDRLIVSVAGSGSAVDGGAGTDTLVVSGAVTLGTLAGLEAIELIGGASLTLTAAQFNIGFLNPISQIGSAAVSGTGSLVFNMDSNPVVSVLYLTGLSFTGGSNVAVTINGSSGIDVVKGAVAVSNTITGGDGADQIRGGNQADTINGGNGNDKLFGWGGVDVLTGGTGADQFRYFFATDSGTGAAADRITDFEIGIDKLNFTLIDTNPGLAGGQSFAFLGTADFPASGTGQIRYLTSGSNLIVQADVNGDGAADMEVILQGLAGQTLTASNFMLGTPPALEPPSAKGIGSGVDVLQLPRSDKGSGELDGLPQPVNALIGFEFIGEAVHAEEPGLLNFRFEYHPELGLI